MTRTMHRWETLPGNYDKLNLSVTFESDNKYGIPTIKKEDFVPDWLVPYRQRIRTDLDISTGAVHFFLDDYRFEPVWTKPMDTFSVVSKIGAALSPDFSLYTKYPISAQIWNTYRNRWLGCFWQAQNLKVIPTICWSDEKSYEFCFLGVEKGSTVAISTVGANKSKNAGEFFKKGYFKMIEVIEPSLILCYGESAPFNLEEYNKVRWYPSYWKNIRDALKQKEGNIAYESNQ